MYREQYWSLQRNESPRCTFFFSLGSDGIERRIGAAQIRGDAPGLDECLVMIRPVPIAAPRCLSLHKDGGASRLCNDRSRSGTLRGLSPMTTLAPLRPKRVPPRDRYRCCHW